MALKHLTINGVAKSIPEWAKLVGISVPAMYGRLRTLINLRGPATSFSRPSFSGLTESERLLLIRPPTPIPPQTVDVQEACTRLGISRQGVYARLRKVGTKYSSPEEAVGLVSSDPLAEYEK